MAKKKKKNNIVAEVGLDGTITKYNSNNVKSNKSNNSVVAEVGLDGSITKFETTTKKKKQEEQKKEQKKNTWFSSGAFDDGYQLGDISKTLLGTADDISKNLSKGVLNLYEGILDLGTYGVAAGAKAIGQDKAAEKIKKFGQKNLTDEIAPYSGGAISTINNIVNAKDIGKKISQSINKDDSFKTILKKSGNAYKDLMSNTINNNSVLGDKSDNIVQGLGYVGGMVATAGIGSAAGLSSTATTMATTFSSTMGQEITNAFDKKASYGEAFSSGLISGLSEAGSEMLFGGLGKTIGKGALDDVVASGVGKIFKKQLTKNLAEFGVKASGEGLEEIISSAGQELGRAMTYGSEYKDPTEFFKDPQRLEEFINGAIVSSLVQTPGLVKSNKLGRDYIEGTTTNEQKVIDSEVNKRSTELQKKQAVDIEVNNQIQQLEKNVGTITEAQKKNIRAEIQTKLDNGEIDYSTTKLSNKEVTNIKNQVKEDLQRGNIDIDTIESTLTSQKTGQIKELQQELTNTKDNVKKAEIQAKINELTTSKASEMQSLLKNDNLLNESYRQEALKKQEFSRETTDKDSDITKELLESAKSVKMNDTNKMHDLFEYTNKIANDTKTKYGFINNEQLKQLGHEVEGKNVNGLVRVNEDGTQKVLINVDSDQAINKIVGHETTHLLEGTQEYTDLQQMIKEYATTKGDYDTRLKSTQEMYKGVDANIENEVTSDLVGDYLFTDEKFINQLSAQKPNVFQKVYNEIKHLYKMATAGSKEARQLEKVKYRFDKAYKEMSNAQQTNLNTEDTNTKANTKYSLSDNDLKNKQNDIIQNSNPVEDDIHTWIRNVDDIKTFEETLNDDSYKEYYDAGEDFDPSYTADMAKEALNTGEITVYSSYPIKDGIFVSPSKMEAESYSGNGKVYSKKVNLKDVAWIDPTQGQYAKVDDTKYSVSDNQGRELTKEQQDYFKDSKVRDDEGHLLEVYHGSPISGINQFDINKSGKNTMSGEYGIYFTDSKKFADDFSYERLETDSMFFDKKGNKGTIYPVYLDIKNPLDFSTLTEQDISNLYEYASDLGKLDGKDQFISNMERWKNIGNHQLMKGNLELRKLSEAGYDGFIAKLDVKGKEQEYVVFNSNQIKNVDNINPTDNPDIRMSLSNQNEEISPTGNYNVYGKDVKLQEQEKTTNEIAPTGNYRRYKALTTEDIPEIEQQNAEAFKNLNEKDIPIEKEDTTPENTITAPIEENKVVTTKEDVKETIKNELNLDDRTANSVYKSITGIEDFDITDVRNALKPYTQIVTKETNENLKELKNSIRTTKLDVSYLKAADSNFNESVKQAFGKMRLANSGTPIDTYYQEMSGLYPELLPSDITNEADQFDKLLELSKQDINTYDIQDVPEEYIDSVAENIYEKAKQEQETQSVNKKMKSEEELANEYYSNIPIDESNIPKYEANVSNNQDIEEIAPIKNETPKENLSIKDSNKLKLENYNNLLNKYKQDSNDSFDTFNQLISDKKQEYNNLANKNTKKANNVLQQISNLNAQRDNIQIEYERKINNISNRIDKMNSKEFKTAEQRKTVQDEYRQQARELIGDTTFWKDKKTGMQYQINTMKRNLRDIIKNSDGKADIETSDKIYNEYFRKYDINQSEVNREANDYKKKYEDLNINSKEHEYIQMLGEYKYNPDTALTQQQVVDFLNNNKSKIDEDKVDKVIEYAKKDYDELFKRINATLKKQGIKEMPYREGYFPHFTEQKQGLLGKIFDWKPANDDIPTDIAGLTELNNPEKSWQSFNKHRQGDTTTYNFGKGFDTYLNGALDWIHHIEDIQKVRALENEIRYQHSADGVKEQIDNVYNDNTLDADEVQERIDSIYKNASNPLNNFVTDLRNWTNNVAGKKSSMDRNLEYATNRKIYSTMTNISNRVSGNMIGGSLSSALTNFIPITQSWGTVSPTSSLKAMVDTIKATIKDDGFVNKSTFLTNRLNESENLYKSNWDKLNKKVGVLFDGIDSFVAQTITRSKYAENIKNGMSESEAMLDADQYSKDVIGGRSKGDMPTLFNSKNPVTKLFTAFQLEVNNQYAHMFKDMPTEVGSKSKAKLVKGYATMFIGASLYNALYSSLVGRDAAFDPIGLIKDILETIGDDEEKDEEKFMSIFEDVAQQLPFVGGVFGGGRLPISGAIPYDNPISMFTGTAQDLLKTSDSEKKDKALKDLTSEWLKPVTYLALPFGGGQIKKTAEGLAMFDENLPISGSYTNNNELRFAVDNTTENKVQAALFGRWANDNAQEYIDKGYAPLKEKQIKEMTELNIPYKKYRQYRDDFSDIREIKSDKDENGKTISGSATGKRAYSIMNGKYSDEEKTYLLSALSEKDNDPTINDLSKFNNNKDVYKYYFKLSKKGKSDFMNAVDEYGFSAEKLYEFNNLLKNIKGNYKKLRGNVDEDSYSSDEYGDMTSSLSKEQRSTIINEISSFATTDKQKSFLYQKAYGESDEVNTIVKTGVGMDNYFGLILNDFQSSKNAKGKTIKNSKKNKIVNYINSLNLDYNQKIILYKTQYSSDNTYNRAILNYVNNNSNFNTNDKRSILKSLNFEVNKVGDVRW